MHICTTARPDQPTDHRTAFIHPSTIDGGALSPGRTLWHCVLATIVQNSAPLRSPGTTQWFYQFYAVDSLARVQIVQPVVVSRERDRVSIDCYALSGVCSASCARTRVSCARGSSAARLSDRRQSCSRRVRSNIETLARACHPSVGYSCVFFVCSAAVGVRFNIVVVTKLRAS